MLDKFPDLTPHPSICITRPQRNLLRHLYSKPKDFSLHSLAQACGCSTASVSRAVNALETKGLVRFSMKNHRQISGVEINPTIDLARVRVGYQPRGINAKGATS